MDRGADRPGADPQKSHDSVATHSPSRNEQGDRGPASAPASRRSGLVITFAVLFILIAAGFGYWYIGSRRYVATDDAFVDGDRAAVSAKMLGRIVRLTADEGDTVSAGQVLVQLDDSDLRSQEVQANASLDLARRSVVLAEVNLERAKDDFRRAEMADKSDATTKEQYSHAQKALQASRAEYDIAVSRVGIARSQLEVVRTQLQNTTIRAPMSGVVAKRWSLPGEVVQPGQAILAIQDLEHVWVTANLGETSLKLIARNDLVEISVDAYPGKILRGRVEEIGSSTASQFSLIPPSNASGNYTKVTQRIPVRISLLPAEPGDARPRLLPGMSVEIKIRKRQELTR